jgi:AraC-like DNA-binding protein
MGEGHDRASGSPAGSSALAAEPASDTLSEVLRTVRLTGALFFLVDAGAPWVSEVPDAAEFAPLVLPGVDQLVSYHIVAKGPCWGGLRGQPPVRLDTGDILLIPHGDAYAMASAPELRAPNDPEAAMAFFRDMMSGELGPFVIEGGAGARTRLVCGFLGCDVRPFNPLLASLPALVHLRRPPGEVGDRLDPLIEFALAESRERRSGGQCVLLRLSELMFVEVVRRYVAALPPRQAGWLAGLRDVDVGRALGLLHAQPARPWTLDGLAREAGLSRSTLAERFTQLVGQPPMHYLAQWRMQLAARRLTDGAAKVHAVALEVGYDSEAAFSRAFKKIVGASPAAWRRARSQG